jgi:hypothetical protein
MDEEDESRHKMDSDKDKVLMLNEYEEERKV